ncbi:MAG: ABC transporter substrate-binding protein [Bacteroidota bacterium]
MAVQEYRQSDHRRIETGVLIRTSIKISFRILLLCSILMMCAGCKKGSNDVPGKRTISVTDHRGRTVALERPAKRIVSLLESATTGLYMLSAENALIGVSTNLYSKSLFPYYSALDERIRQRTLPAPGNWDAVSLEGVVALQPDIVIIWASQSESIEALETHNLRVYAIDIRSTEDIIKEIRDLGMLTGREERAEQLIAWSNTKRENGVQQKETPPRVYFMWSSGIFETAGRISAVNNIITAAGCENASPTVQEHLSINAETLIDWDPDVILMWSNDALEPEDVMKTDVLRTVKAVRTGNVFELPSAFDCDLWTLKYRFAEDFLSMKVRGIHDGRSMRSHRDSIMTFLYGKAL